MRTTVQQAQHESRVEKSEEYLADFTGGENPYATRATEILGRWKGGEYGERAAVEALSAANAYATLAVAFEQYVASSEKKS